MVDVREATSADRSAVRDVHVAAVRDGLRGVSTVALTASVNAAGFYEAHGYERVAETEHAFGDDAATGPVVVMRRQL